MSHDRLKELTDHFQEIIEYLDKMFNECGSIIDSLANNPDKSNSDINDLCNMYRIWEKQSHVRYKILVVVAFAMLLHKIQHKEDRSEIQKMARTHIKDLDNYIEKQIEIGETWKFENFRCRDYMLRWIDFLVEVDKFVQCRIDNFDK